MWKIRAKVVLLALYIDVLSFTHLVSGSYPRAQNVTWTSTNFKTLLMWGPKAENFSYTVDYSVIGQNRLQNPHCLRSRETLCDLSSSLKELKMTYMAEVVTEPPRGVDSDLVEFPFTRSTAFCPYLDTDIGRPAFTVVVGKDPRSVTLRVDDPLTALFDRERQLTVRDVFGDELHYKVTYRRATSTGMKEYVSKDSVIELTSLDRGGSYCFEVQAYIPSRKAKELGEFSHTQCSEGEKSFSDVYSVPVLAGGVLIILALVAVVIGVTVLCCRRRRRETQSSKERELL